MEMAVQDPPPINADSKKKSLIRGQIAKACEIMSLNHPLVNNYFFVKTSLEAPEKLQGSRVEPIISFFKSQNEIDNERTRKLSKVLISFNDKNENEFMSTIIGLKADGVFLDHIENEYLVAEIIERMLISKRSSKRWSSKPDDTPNESTDTAEKPKRTTTMDFDEQLPLLSKKMNDESLKNTTQTTKPKSYQSTGGLSNRKGSDPRKLNQSTKIEQEIREFQLNFFNKLVELFFTTSVHRELRNLIELFTSIIGRSISDEGLTDYVDDVFYKPKFHDRLLQMLFNHKNDEKFEKVGRFLIVLIDHYEDKSHQKSQKESVAYLSSSFYRFISDCIEPLIQIMSEVV